MEKAYLITLKSDNTRNKTYARGVHYQVVEPEDIKTINEQGEEVVTGKTEEQIIPLVSNFDLDTILSNGGKWLTSEEYVTLLKTKVYSA